ncbi:MAG: type II secretion system protein [Verrucomicrobia bacterium]|nr:type II secretion system protein [Verrucomicrobiota bacterium]
MKAGFVSSSNTRTKSGLTLIELLLVIAVIAILASLIFPALSRPKNGAHTVKCGSNVRQIALALPFYVEQRSIPLPGIQGANDATQS